MGTYGRLREDLEPLFTDVLATTGSVVAALYRKNAMGEYAPVFWMPHKEGLEPSHVTSASDLASFIRVLDVDHFEMGSSTFRDNLVRRGLQAFGASKLLTIPLPGVASGRYIFNAGTASSYGERERELLIGYARRLGRALDAATLSVRVRGGVPWDYHELEVGAEAQPAPASGDARPFPLLSHVVEGDGFQDLVVRAHKLIGLPDACIMIEDAEGLVLAKAGPCGDVPSTGQWLSAFPRLPYLDWMEDSRQPVFVPSTDDVSGRGRLAIPLFGRKNYHGIVSVIPLTRDEVSAHVRLLTELRLSAMYLIRYKEASRGHVLRRSLSSVENERARIAIELHDETSQNLVALKVRIVTAQHALARGMADDAQGIMEDCARISDEILDGVNRLAANLRPSELSYLGLRPAIEAVAEARLTRAGIAYHISGNATDAHFGALAERMLLNGVVEAISNCARHSLAKNVEIEMRDEGSWFSIAVRDDGKGYDPSNAGNGIGVKAMRDCSRAIGGDFWIGSTPGTGTTVRFSVPMSQVEEVDGE